MDNNIKSKLYNILVNGNEYYTGEDIYNELIKAGFIISEGWQSINKVRESLEKIKNRKTEFGEKLTIACAANIAMEALKELDKLMGFEDEKESYN